MRSAQVAAEAGVNVQTLRYYERRGLLAEPDRLDSGYRAYGPEAVRVVLFVKSAQLLGFSLEEIESLLETDKRFVELLGKDPAFRAKFVLESSGRAVAEELDV